MGQDPVSAPGGGPKVAGRYFGEQPLALTLTLGGRLAEILQLTDGGDFTFVVPLEASEPFEVAALPGGSQTCALVNASGQMPATGVSNVWVRCGRILTFDPGAAAFSVVGQPDFTSNAANATADARSLVHPATIWHTHLIDYNQLYVVDAGRNRIVAIPFTATRGGIPTALFAIGQPNLTSGNPGSTASTLHTPAGLASDSTVLAVSDMANNRVLLFRPFPRGMQNAAAALGQPALDANTPSCGPTGLNQPSGVAMAAGRLVVADALNNRVLIWRALPTLNGQAPDLVLGQSVLDTCTAAPTSAGGLRTPAGVWTDGQRLVVADTGNNRVLIWNAFPTTSGQPADVVLGQPDMLQATAAISATSLSAPVTAHSNNLQLLIADAGNQRVLIWNAFPLQSGTAADMVLGQPDFTTAGAHVTSSGLANPVALTSSDNLVIVSDADNNRLMVFASKT